MDPESVQLSVLEGTGTGSYRFICPACMALVEKRADRKIVDLLRSVGVSTASVSVQGAYHPSYGLADGQPPLEGLDDPAARGLPGRVGWEVPPLTHDDLITFHFLLEDDDWLAEAFGEDPSGP